MAHGNLYDARQKLKIAFLSVSVLLVALFLVISNRLVEDLSTEERNKWRYGPKLPVRSPATSRIST